MFLRLIIATAFLATALAFVGLPQNCRARTSLPVALKQQSYGRKPTTQELADRVTNFVPTVILALASTVEPSMLLLLVRNFT
jgi:hypothetical protein